MVYFSPKGDVGDRPVTDTQDDRPPLQPHLRVTSRAKPGKAYITPTAHGQWG